MRKRQKLLFLLVVFLLLIGSTALTAPVAVGDENAAYRNPEDTWTAPVKTVTSKGKSQRRNGTVISPDDFGIVLEVRNNSGGWFLIDALEDGDYVFSVRAPYLSRNNFIMRFYNENDQLASAVFERSDKIQHFVFEGVKAGQTIYWWDDDNSGRWYTMLDPYEFMITIRKADTASETAEKNLETLEDVSSVSSQSPESAPEENPGGSFSFEAIDGGKCRISGYTGKDAVIAIPETGPDGCTVTEIGKSTFAWNKNLTSVTIPNGVISIGDQAFAQCRNLTAVALPESLTSIGKLAFAQCSSLVTINIPENIVFIGDYAFKGCSSLTSVMVPSGEASVSSTAFDPSAGVPSAGNAPAEENPETAPAEPESSEERQADYAVSDIITLGHYEQDNNLSNGPEPIEWQVLAVEEGRALVISRYALDWYRYYDKAYVKVTWADSTMRSWLNGEFISTAFSSEEAARILEVTVENPSNPQYGTDGGRNTLDQLFLLSIAEAKKYFEDDSARLCQPTAYAKGKDGFVEKGIAYWGLRTPGYTPYTVAIIDSLGRIYMEGSTAVNSVGLVRPAFWLDLTAIPSSPETPEPTQAPTQVLTRTPVPTAVSSSETRLRAGDIITFGHYEQDNDLSNGPEPIEWLILDVRGGGRKLVISKYALDVKPYNTKYKKVTWETCTLRSWLNGEFFNSAFSRDERDLILETDIRDRYLSRTVSTTDRIFLLGYSEVNKYLPDYDARICQITEYAKTQGAWYSSWDDSTCWWLRTTGYDKDLGSNGQAVNANGYVDTFGEMVDETWVTVRPVMWVIYY